MTNEPTWDYISTNNYRKDTRAGKQKENLATHAKQITQYLDENTVNDSEAAKNYSDTTLPGVRVPLAFPEQQRVKPMRASMRNLAKKSNSVKEKKKNSEKRKSGRRKNSSSPEEEKTKQVCDAAGQTDSGPQKEVARQETKTEDSGNVATAEERPIITSLNATELMLLSADKGDMGTMQVLFDKPSEHSKSLCITKDEKGETPLHKTAKGGYLKCLKFLASHVPHKVSCVDNSGMTPAAHAAKNGHVNCLKWLVEESSAYVELAVRDGQMSLLHYAAAEGMEQCLSYLLGFMAKRKITTDIVDSQGQTPLHAAAKMGHLACVQTLVEHGGDVLAKDHEGLTSTNVAYLQKQAICSRYLLMAESCWILASRVATLFREVNGFKKENKELKKTVENLKSSKKCDLPNRPETVGAHTNDNGNQGDDCSRRDSIEASIGPRERNFPDGESPKSTFTEADKQRPQIISQKNHVINVDDEVNDAKHFKVIRQTSNQSDSNPIPAVSTNAIAEIPPAEKVKAKEIAMVTHQLMSTRHMQIIQEKKTKQTNKEDVTPKVSLDDSAVVRRTNPVKNRNLRPKSLCDSELVFMRSATDINFTHKAKKPVLERRASCTELATQSGHALESFSNGKDDGSKEKNFWDRVGAKKLLSRKKSAKPRPQSASLSDLQTVSTDKILELYARESRGGTSRINSLIWEENEVSPSMGRRAVSTTELKSQAYTRDGNVHASFREPRAGFQPLSDFRMSERFTPSTSSAKGLSSDPERKRVRPVAKPRLKLKSVSDSDVAACEKNKEPSRAKDIEGRFQKDIEGSSEKLLTKSKRYGEEESFGNASWKDGHVQEFDVSRAADESLECTDV